MKKISLALITTLLLLVIAPASSRAGTDNSEATTSTKTTESADARIFLTRLEQIKGMDISTMNASEKRALRKEVRSIKYHLRHDDGGIYLSVGAVIIIILLLILLL